MWIKKNIWLSTFILFNSTVSVAQIKIMGHVYDESKVFPIESVSVISNSGVGTITDKSGRYELIVSQKDSIWFSYLGKTTSKFSVEAIKDMSDFNISIIVPPTVLPRVRVISLNYKMDSINNRNDYKKVFDYQKPSFRSIVPYIGITGFSIDLDELIRFFKFRQNKNMLKFKNRLINQEQQKSIARKFNKQVIKEAIDIPESELEKFIDLYSPSYTFTSTATEYEIKKYIKESYKKFKNL